MYSITYKKLNTRNRKMTVSAGNVGDTISRLELNGYTVTKVVEIA